MPTLETEIVTADPTELLLKQRELALLRSKLALVKSNGLAFYRPHEKQHEFHKSSAKRRGVFAGNRFGKSEMDAAETVAWFIGERTWYKYDFPIYGMRDGAKIVVDWHHGHENHPLVRQGIPQHATKQLVIATEWKKVDEVWTAVLGDPPGKLWKFIPADLEVSTSRNHEGTIDQVYDVKTKAVIRFTTETAFIKNPQSGESTDYDRIAIDEPIVEDMWKAHSRGLIDRDGQGDFTLTALRERWIYDYFNPATEDPEERKAGRWSVRASMHDNPHLTPEAKQRYIDDLTEDEIQCRVEGLPLEFSGMVYKEFRRERHVLTHIPIGWTSYTNPPPSSTIYVAIDVHSQTPQAVMFVAVGPVGAPIVYDEIWLPCHAEDLAAEVNLRLIGRTIGFMKVDPRAWEEDPVYGTSMATVFANAGLPIEKATKAKSYGILNMRAVLKKPDAIFFCPTVKRTLWEISRYCYDKENKPIDKDDHFMENMYRIFFNELPCLGTLHSAPIEESSIDMSSRTLRDDPEDKFLSAVQALKDL
jgi:hypothetical protein